MGENMSYWISIKGYNAYFYLSSIFLAPLNQVDIWGNLHRLKGNIKWSNIVKDLSTRWRSTKKAHGPDACVEHVINLDRAALITYLAVALEDKCSEKDPSTKPLVTTSFWGHIFCTVIPCPYNTTDTWSYHCFTKLETSCCVTLGMWSTWKTQYSRTQPLGRAIIIYTILKLMLLVFQPFATSTTTTVTFDHFNKVVLLDVIYHGTIAFPHSLYIVIEGSNSAFYRHYKGKHAPSSSSLQSYCNQHS